MYSSTSTTGRASLADQIYYSGIHARERASRNLDAFRGSISGALDRKTIASTIGRGLEGFTAPEVEQLQALSEGLGRPFEEVALYNMYPSLTRENDCSVYGALGTATRSGRTIFGKNSDKQGDATLVGDGYRFHREINVLVDYVTDTGLRVLGMAAAGKLGLKFSVNSAGVAGGTNYAHTAEEQRLKKLGELSVSDQLAQDRAMLLRRAMEFADAREAAKATLATVLDSPMSTPGNLEFADARHVYVVESSYQESAIVSYTDGVVVRTNRFESLAHLNGASESSDRRYERITSLLGKRRGDLTGDDLEQVSQDHLNGPSALSVCTHGPGHGSRTMGAMVVSFADEGAPPTYAFAVGSPCRAWASSDGTVRGTVTLEGSKLPEAFLNGDAWAEHYIAEELPVS